MSKKGGAGSYRKGANYERKVQAYLEEAGWLVTRQPKSQSPYDLMGVPPAGVPVYLIQCKLSRRMSRAEKVELHDLALRFRAVPCEACGLDGVDVRRIQPWELT